MSKGWFGNVKRAIDLEPNAPIPLMSEENRVRMRVEAIKQARRRLDDAVAHVGDMVRDWAHAREMFKHDLDEMDFALTIDVDPLPPELEIFLTAQSDWVDETPEDNDA